MSKRLYTHAKGLFLDYKTLSQDFENHHFNNEKWHIKDYWYVFIRFDKKWIGYEDLYYDGHTVQAVTFLGVTIGKGYSYDSRPLVKWTDEELACA